MIARRALILVAPLVGVGACTTLLGDFSPGPMMTTGDGGDASGGGSPEAAPDGSLDGVASEGQVPEGATPDVTADQATMDQTLADQATAEQTAIELAGALSSQH